MTIDRDIARTIAGLDDDNATRWLRDEGLLDGDGLEEMLEAARSLMRDDPAVGERLAQLVRGLATAAEAPVALPRATYLLAQARAGSGEMTEALALIDEARTGFEALGRTTEAMRTNLGRSQALNEMGRHDDALAACTEILRHTESMTMTEPSVMALTSAAHQNSGLCLELSGRFEDALDHYGSAQIGYESLGDAQAVAEVRYDRALVLLSLGQHQEALLALQRASESFRQGGFRALEVMALAHTAEVQLHRGEYQQCLASLADAAAALEGISSPGGEQVRLIMAGRAYLALNLLPEAVSSFGEAVALLADTDLVIDRARAEWGHGLALARTERGAAAATALEAAADQYRRSGQSTWLAAVLVDHARLLRGAGDIGGAEHAAAEALGVAPVGTPAAATAELLLAELHRPLDIERLAAAVHTIEELELAPLTASATHALGRALLEMNRPVEAYEHLRRAVDAVELLRGNLVHELVLTRFLDDKLSPYEDLLAASIALEMPPGVSLQISEQAKSRTLSDLVSGLVARGVDVDEAPDDDLRALYGELFAGESANDPDRSARLRDRVRDLEAQRGLGRLRSMSVDATPLRPVPDDSPVPGRPDDVAVTYARAGDALHAFVVDGDDVIVVRDIASVAAVSALTERLRRQWERFRLGSVVVERHLPQLLASATALLAELYEALFAPIETVLAPRLPRRLVIVPDPSLHEVPFHALWDGTGWLRDRFEIHYSPSLGTLRHLPAARTGDLLVVGVADELAPMVTEEVDAVVAIRPDALAFIGEQGVWSELEWRFEEAAQLHLSCHAMFRPDNPMYSALRLHDRWVTAADILCLDLSGAIVVLSACDTARSTHAGSAEINGFVRGFLGAGARTVIASQWTADDQATTEFMSALYAEMADHDPASAVRHAQRAIATRWPHPYYWAPWIVVGRSDSV